MRGGGASNRYTLDTLREVGRYSEGEKVPKRVLMRGMLFYLRLMILQFCSGVWPLSYLFRSSVRCGPGTDRRRLA